MKGTANSPACRRRWVAAGLLLAGATAAGYLGVTAWADFHASAAVEALDQLRFEDARWHAERCLAVRPGDLDARLLAARAARRAGDRGAAGRHLDECKRRGELTPALGLEYVLLRAEQGHLGDTVASLRSRVTGGRDDLPVLEALAQGHLAAGRTSEAIGYLDDLLRLAPDHPRAYAWRARGWGQLGKWEKALADAGKAAELRPGSEEARWELAEALRETARPAAAAAQYEWLRRRQPGSAEVLLGLARCRLTLAELGEARRLLDEVLARRPGHAPALTERGRVALREGETSQAIGYFRRAVTRAPRNLDAGRLLVAALREEGRSEEAAGAAEQLRRQEAVAGRFVRLQTAVQDAPEDPERCYALGIFLLENGREPEGLGWLARALELDPGYSAAREAFDAHTRRRPAGLGSGR